MKNFVKNVSDLVNISAECSRAGLILFARNAWISFTLKEHITLTSLKDAIDQIKYTELPKERGTNTPAALQLLKTAGANGTLGLRDGKIHIAIIITDAITYLPHLKINRTEANKITKLAGNELRESRLYDQIYAVGIKGNENTLSYIATPPSLTFSLFEFNQSLFNELTMNISKILCNGKCMRMINFDPQHVAS